MQLAAQKLEIQVAEVFFLPLAHITKAQKLLREIQPLNMQNLGLAVLSIYHQELDWAVKNFPTQFHDQYVLPELKSRRLAFACRIEFMQTPTA
jgi:hypothetical protein